MDYNKRKIILKGKEGAEISFDVGQIVSLFFDLMEIIQNFQNIILASFYNIETVKETFINSLPVKLNDEEIEDLEKEVSKLDEKEMARVLKEKLKESFIKF